MILINILNDLYKQRKLYLCGNSIHLFLISHNNY